jgi:hypothetical protein
MNFACSLGANIFYYQLWTDDPNEKRNSRNNIRRGFWFSNSASRFTGQETNADTRFDF